MKKEVNIMKVILGILLFLAIYGAAKVFAGDPPERISPEQDEKEFEDWLLYEADDDEY